MLTIEILDFLPLGAIIRSGTFIDSKEEGDGNIALCFPISNRSVKWVAVKGEHPRHSDWCIYAENPHYQGTGAEFLSFGDVKRRGDKLTIEHNIKKLVPCTDEVFERYRF